MLKLFSLSLIFAAQFSYAAFDSQFYHHRYGRTDVYSKVVDNKGNGFEELYGTRNVREVLKGVLYRGGGNNLYHRDPSKRRDNRNPLPMDGVINLCEEGFHNAIYLYSTNFDKAPPQTDCSSIRGQNRLIYEQLGFMGKTREILERVHAGVVNPAKAPVYVHCWNGWHASGFIGALSVRQFCGVGPNEAEAYWIKNTDGTDDGSYKTHKKLIREFVPYNDLKVDAATQARICPRL
jgi:hypothetical protein